MFAVRVLDVLKEVWILYSRENVLTSAAPFELKAAFAAQYSNVHNSPGPNKVPAQANEQDKT